MYVAELSMLNFVANLGHLTRCMPQFMSYVLLVERPSASSLCALCCPELTFVDSFKSHLTGTSLRLANLDLDIHGQALKCSTDAFAKMLDLQEPPLHEASVTGFYCPWQESEIAAVLRRCGVRPAHARFPVHFIRHRYTTGLLRQRLHSVSEHRRMPTAAFP